MDYKVCGCEEWCECGMGIVIDWDLMGLVLFGVREKMFVVLF